MRETGSSKHHANSGWHAPASCAVSKNGRGDVYRSPVAEKTSDESGYELSVPSIMNMKGKTPLRFALTWCLAGIDGGETCLYQPIPNLALSGATRMGVAAFAKSLSEEVGRDGILINNVCPGSLLSDRMLENVTARARKLGISVEQALAKRANEIAVGRIGEPRELANLVAFLASGKSSYITGTTIRVDGGLVRSVL